MANPSEIKLSYESEFFDGVLTSLKIKVRKKLLIIILKYYFFKLNTLKE